MKAAAFEYVRAKSTEDVCRMLAINDERERKIIAGGQTLVPLMAMRLARPDVLIDINDLEDLSGIGMNDHHLTIGAMTRQREIERSDLVAQHLPLLAKAIRHVGHRQTRNRGTIGGSIAHGDPSAEIPLAALALDAAVVLRDLEGEQTMPIAAFHESAMVTALRPDQILTSVRFPVRDAARTGSGFQEIASRAGDFAIVAAAACLKLDGDGVVCDARLAAGGVAPVPVRLHEAESRLRKTAADADATDRALDGLDDLVEPESDVHATADYRRRVIRRLLERTIAEALENATA